MEELRIEWYGPYRYEDVRSWENAKAAGCLFVAKQKGLYAITRKWGGSQKRVLYMGETFRANIIARMNQHGQWLDRLRGDIRVRIGVVSQDHWGAKITQQKVFDAESLFIILLQPEFNRKGKKFYYGRHLTVVSSGARGPIQEVISTEELECA